MKNIITETMKADRFALEVKRVYTYRVFVNGNNEISIAVQKTNDFRACETSEAICTMSIDTFDRLSVDDINWIVYDLRLHIRLGNYVISYDVNNEGCLNAKISACYAESALDITEYYSRQFTLAPVSDPEKNLPITCAYSAHDTKGDTTMKESKKLTKSAVYAMVKADYTMLYKPMSAEIRDLFPVFTIDDCNACGLHWTIKHTGKMIGNVSLSTTCKTNKFCRARIEKAFRLVIPGFCLDTATKEEINKARALLSAYIKQNPLARDASICGFCFSDKQQDNYTTMTPCLDRNAQILNGGIIHSDWIPFVNAAIARQEAFGDFGSVNAAQNAVNLVSKNPHAFFGVWTKNPALFHKVFKGDVSRKPSNMNLILSSQYINRKTSVNPCHAYMIDAVFTVYTAEYAAEHGIAINCGARACLSCLKCYQKHNNSLIDISELLK